MDDFKCPECREPLQLADANVLGEYFCQSCGSAVSTASYGDPSAFVDESPSSSPRDSWQDRAVILQEELPTAESATEEAPDEESYEAIDDGRSLEEQEREKEINGLLDRSSFDIDRHIHRRADNRMTVAEEKSIDDAVELELYVEEVEAPAPPDFAAILQANRQEIVPDFLNFTSSAPVKAGKKTCPMCGSEIAVASERCEFCGEDFTRKLDRVNLKSGPGGSRHLLYAGFWARVSAFWIDMFLLMIPVAIFVYSDFGSRFETSDVVRDLPQIFLRGYVFLLGLPYYVLMETSEFRGTFGKRMMGIMVVDTSGKRLTFWRATLRYLMRIPAEMMCLVGYFMVGLTDKLQGMHDVFSGCLVIRRQSLS